MPKRFSAHLLPAATLRHLFRLSLLILLIVALLAANAVAQNPTNSGLLELGKSVERELGGGQSHTYVITLAAGQYMRLLVEQRGIDVVIRLFAPDGTKLGEVDSPNGTNGPELINWIGEAAGSYRLEVSSLEKDAATGRYQASLELLRDATAEEKARFAAHRLYTETLRQINPNSKQSLLEAARKFEQALVLYRSGNDKLGEANALGKIGTVYGVLADPRKALEYFMQVLPLRRTVKDVKGEAGALHDIGYSYMMLGEHQKAIEYYTQALSLQQTIKDTRGAAVTLANIGQTYDDLGEKQKALDYDIQAASIFRQIGDRFNEAATLNNIGTIYGSLGELEKALESFTQVLEIRRALKDKNGESATLNNIGYIYGDLNDKRKAIEYLNQVISIVRTTGDRRGEAAALNNIGSMYNDLGEWQKALEYFVQALPIRREVGDRSGEAATLNNIGAAYSNLNEKQKALEYLSQALSLSRAVNDGRSQAVALYRIAVIERDRGNHLQARSHIEAALAIVESLRSKIIDQRLRASYFATVQNYYQFYIDLLMRLSKQSPAAGHDGEALQVSERARARALLDLLAEAGADIRQGVDPSLLERERSLRGELNAKAQQQTRLLSGKHTTEQANASSTELEKLTTEVQQVEAQIRQKSPNYAALTQPQPLSVREIQAQLLDQNTLLLEYSLGADRSYLWAVTHDAIYSYELPKREEIEAAARQVYELLDERNREVEGETEAQERARIARADAQYAAASARLSQLVLAPVGARLGNKRLLIVADGTLQYIPFAALPVPLSASGQRRSPLIVRHEIVNLPSASTLAVLRSELRGRKPAPKTLAVLADPVFGTDDERVRRQQRPAPAAANGNDQPPAQKREIPLSLKRAAEESGLRTAELNLPRLPGTRDEGQRLLSLVPPSQRRAAFDFAANRQTATSTELSQYRYVHFATHGFLNSLHPELSGIVLSMVDEKGVPQDGFLRAHEVFNLKLSAELVVLSACQTGLGKEVKGEGLVGLTRGFMYAGSPRVVVSLWNVSDDGTAELMKRFYRAMLTEKMRPAEALRHAQLSMLREQGNDWASPFYWAAFILQGEWR